VYSPYTARHVQLLTYLKLARRRLAADLCRRCPAESVLIILSSLVCDFTSPLVVSLPASSGVDFVGSALFTRAFTLASDDLNHIDNDAMIARVSCLRQRSFGKLTIL